jgi:hypothetical protein
VENSFDCGLFLSSVGCGDPDLNIFRAFYGIARGTYSLDGPGSIGHVDEIGQPLPLVRHMLGGAGVSKPVTVASWVKARSSRYQSIILDL